MLFRSCRSYRSMNGPLCRGATNAGRVKRGALSGAVFLRWLPPDPVGPAVQYQSNPHDEGGRQIAEEMPYHPNRLLRGCNLPRIPVFHPTIAHPKNLPSLALYHRYADRKKRSHPTIAHPKNSLNRCEFSGAPGPLVGRSLEIAGEMQSVGDPGGANKRGQGGTMQILGGPRPSCATMPGG